MGPGHVLHVALVDGFRGHTVVVVVDGHEVYRRADITSDFGCAPADHFEVRTGSRTARISVSVTPGDLAASLDVVDVTASPHIAISLIGEGSVSLESCICPVV